MTHLIDIIAGARPNFMKIAPLIRALEINAGPESDMHLPWRLVHTGQHYDTAMSGAFFRQLGIREPHVNLEAGSGTQAEQTAAIMVRYEQLLRNHPASLCLVAGDVTSTMACAITAQKMGVAVGHIEAGIRSGDWTMPEEINRLVTDAITNWFFTTSRQAGSNLTASGIPEKRIHFVGNTMIDTLRHHQREFLPPQFFSEMGLGKGEYFVLTLHRPANVDDPNHLSALLRAIDANARNLPVIFPVHPRTAKILSSLPKLPPSIHPVTAQPYLEFNFLVSNARCVITDSGGITEETTVLSVPCMTLRENTERPETVSMGTNELVGTDPAALAPWFDRLFAGKWKVGAIPELWDGKAAERIVMALKHIFSERIKQATPRGQARR